jgi:hypothetical protein
LTTNVRDFAPLGVRDRSQGTDAVVAAFNLRVGETRLQTVVMLPAAPVYVFGASVKWASEKVGPAAWFALAAVVVGGVVLYRKQSQERKEQLRRTALAVVTVLGDEYARASRLIARSQEALGSLVVQAPNQRSDVATVLRKLALSADSMSARQLCDELGDEFHSDVESVRRFLREHSTTMFREVRYGSFVLGSRTASSEAPSSN